MNHLCTEIHVSGKLLISGEYLILRGARGLALPTSRGQHFKVTETRYEGLDWIGVDHLGQVWLEASFDRELNISSSSDNELALRLQGILRVAVRMQPAFLSDLSGFEVRSTLDFPRDWGLGSSGTLIFAIAKWAKIDPLELSERTLGGSGYDVAVAINDTPIIFERSERGIFHTQVSFNPPFTDRIFFVHLGHKQDSRVEVSEFKARSTALEDIQLISQLTNRLIVTKELEEFESHLVMHNAIMERILERPSANSVFKEYTAGVVKYLGAWGGDFMLATGSKADMSYFDALGLKDILSYKQMIKQN